MTLPAASLTGPQRTAYAQARRGTFHCRVVFDLYRRANGNAVGTLTERFMGGSVKGDLAQTPVTLLECDLFDDEGALDWRNGEHRHFDVQVTELTFVPALNDWVSEDKFRGPMWNFDRNGPAVKLVAVGAEKGAEGSFRRARTWPAKSKATDVIRQLLLMAGARRADLVIPDLKATLPRAVTVGVRVGKRRDTNGKKDGKGKDNRRKAQILKVDREDTYWSEAEKIAEALGRDLYADASGKFRLSAPKNRPTLRLDESDLLAPVTEKRATDGEGPNTWIVSGPDPRGPRKRPVARVELPKSHPSSPFSLRWNGTNRYVISTTENRQVRNIKQAKKVAAKSRDRAVRETVTYEVSCFPVSAWWRPEGSVSVPTLSGRVTARVPSWTLPLGPGADPLVLGATRRRGVR